MSQSRRPVRLGVCTSAQRFNVAALLTKLETVPVVSSVELINLPYNDLDSYRLDSKSLDALILCHSINNRRFAVTDIMDALYDRFLPHARKVLGKNNVAVIVHDIDWPLTPNHAGLKEAYMESFRKRQPTTFECASLAMICGKLENVVQIDENDWSKVETFLDNVSSQAVINPVYVILTLVVVVCGAILATLYGAILVPLYGAILVPLCGAMVAFGYRLMTAISALGTDTPVSRIMNYISNKAQHFWVILYSEIISKALYRSEASQDGCLSFLWWIFLVPLKLYWYTFTFICRTVKNYLSL